MADPFVAEIKIFGFNFAPRGWAFCDGQLLPISQNTALFSIVGTTFGGDGRTTLGLPNLQDRAPMHPGTGPGLSQRRLGQVGGVPSVVLTTAHLPAAHNHVGGLSAVPADMNAATDSDPTGNYLAAGERIYRDPNDPDTTLVATGATGGGGDGGAHVNRQPYLGLNFCIALIGTYPSHQGATPQGQTIRVRKSRRQRAVPPPRTKPTRSRLRLGPSADNG